MPGPLDALKAAYGWATTPLVPQSAIQSTQDAIDSPTEGRSPLEAQIRGFGAGALGGLRNLTTPLDIASLAAPTVSRFARGAGAVAEATAPTMDLIEGARSTPQVMPSASDVDSLTGLLKHNLAKVPSSRAVTGAAPAAEFAAATPEAESAFNAARPAARTLPDIGSMGYNNVMRQFSGQEGAISPEMAAITGLTGAGLAYGAKKVYDAFKGPAADAASEVNKKVNPYAAYADKLKGQ